MCIRDSVGRSDTCKKHGGAEKVRKAIVNLLNVFEHNKSVTKTKYWEKLDCNIDQILVILR